MWDDCDSCTHNQFLFNINYHDNDKSFDHVGHLCLDCVRKLHDDDSYPLIALPKKIKYVLRVSFNPMYQDVPEKEPCDWIQTQSKSEFIQTVKEIQINNPNYYLGFEAAVLGNESNSKKVSYRDEIIGGIPYDARENEWMINWIFYYAKWKDLFIDDAIPPDNITMILRPNTIDDEIEMERSNLKEFDSKVVTMKLRQTDKLYNILDAKNDLSTICTLSAFMIERQLLQPIQSSTPFVEILKFMNRKSNLAKDINLARAVYSCMAAKIYQIPISRPLKRKRSVCGCDVSVQTD